MLGTRVLPPASPTRCTAVAALKQNHPNEKCTLTAMNEVQLTCFINELSPQCVAQMHACQVNELQMRHAVETMGLAGICHLKQLHEESDFHWWYARLNPNIVKIDVKHLDLSKELALFPILFQNCTLLEKLVALIQLPCFEEAGQLFEFGEGYYRTSKSFLGHIIICGRVLARSTAPADSATALPLLAIKQGNFLAGSFVASHDIDSSDHAVRSEVRMEAVEDGAYFLVRVVDGLVVDYAEQQKKLIWWWRHKHQHQLFEKRQVGATNRFLLVNKKNGRCIGLTLDGKTWHLTNQMRHALHFSAEGDRLRWTKARDAPPMFEVVVDSRDFIPPPCLKRYGFYFNDVKHLDSVVNNGHLFPTNATTENKLASHNQRNLWVQSAVETLAAQMATFLEFKKEHSAHACAVRTISHPYLPMLILTVDMNLTAEPVLEILRYVRSFLSVLYCEENAETGLLQSRVTPSVDLDHQGNVKSCPGVDVMIRTKYLQSLSALRGKRDLMDDEDVTIFEEHGLDVGTIRQSLLQHYVAEGDGIAADNFECGENTCHFAGYLLIEPWLFYLIIQAKGENATAWRHRHTTEFGNAAAHFHPL